MSCLNLKFPPAGKAWKIFTTKIRRKLRVLHPPKKTKSVYLPGRNRAHCRVRRPAFKRKHRLSPVFIDELFRPVQDTTVLEHDHRAFPLKGEISRSIEVKELPADVAVAETSGVLPEAGEGGESTATAAADEMWESVAMASALMCGIDERAEEFITKFRAEMVHQEMAAGDL